MKLLSHFLLILMVIGVLGGMSIEAEAQLGLAAAPAPAKTDAAPPADELGRDTPRGTVAGFLAAVGEDDMQKAAKYLDLSNLTSSRRTAKGPDLADGLKELLDKGGNLNPPAILSGDAVGKLNDDEPDDIDKVGTISSGGKTVDVLLQRVTDDNDKQVWLFSAQTITQVPALEADLKDPLIDRIFGGWWMDTRWHGAPIAHWLSVVIIFALSYGVSWIFIHMLAAVLQRYSFREKMKRHVVDAFITPLSLYTAVWVFSFSCVYAGISVIVRQYFGQLNVVIAWISLALLLWELIDVGAEFAQKQMSRTGKFKSFSSIVSFVRRITKFFFIVITAIVVLDMLGVNVTAGLAALGIGGIALALGAQKTLENFIGSVALILDHPFHIGDFCRIGDSATGTIEDIGMRSTRVRTNDRTVITIPNGNLSTLVIENYSRRDRILMANKMRIRYDARPEQIADLVQRVKDIFVETPKIIQDPMAVRFLGFTPEALIVEIFVYVATSDFNEFLRVQEEVMQKIMNAVAASGCYFALPLQTFLPPRAQPDFVPSRSADEGSSG